MDKDRLVKKIMEKGKDYTQQTYLAGFLFVFMFLIVVIIRPSVNDYVVRQKQLDETKQMVGEYQKVIVNLTKLQSVLESHRDDFVLLDKAVPSSLGIYQIAKDISSSLLPYTPEKDYEFEGYTLSGSTKSSGTQPKPYIIKSDVQGSFDTLQRILSDVTQQSRVKTIKSVAITRQDASSSANLMMKIEIEAYNL